MFDEYNYRAMFVPTNESYGGVDTIACDPYNVCITFTGRINGTKPQR